MLVSYSQQDSFTVAVEKTFDGKHPCGLCKAVDQGKRSEQKQTLLKTEIKINWMLVETAPLVWFPARVEAIRPREELDLLVFASPPIPPPKTA